MYKIVSLALLVCGVVLLTQGLRSSDSFSSDLNRLFTGSPTEHSLWLLLGGLFGIALGAGGLFYGKKPSL